MSRKTPLTRKDFMNFQQITSRWADNDIYGHVNNVVYYAWFDTATNRYLIESGGLDIHHSPVVAYVVSSQCDYFRPVVYPERIEVALRVAHLGRSSISWEIGIFPAGRDTVCAQGRLVHVFVDKSSQSSVAIPEPVREALERLVLS